MNTGQLCKKQPASITMRFSKQLIRLFIGLLVVSGCLTLYYWSKQASSDSRSDSAGLPVEEVQHYNKQATNYLPDYANEIKAVDVAIANADRWSYVRKGRNSLQSVLCVTFVELTSESLDRYTDNMKNPGTMSCHWVYIVYKYDVNDKDSIVERFKRRNGETPEQPKYDIFFAPPRHNIISSIYDMCRELQDTDDFSSFQLGDSCKTLEAAVMTMHMSAGIGAPENYNSHVYPKILLFMQILPYLDKYRFVWILDGDISVKGFDLTEFLTTMHCAFPKAPLFAQPLVHENTQTYKYLNKKTWTASSTIAAQTGFIEIQVPMVDTLLFRYYLLNFVLPLVLPVHILGADWGFDRLFCRVAKLFDAVTSPEFQELLSQQPAQLLLLPGSRDLFPKSSLQGSSSDLVNAMRSLLRNRKYFKEDFSGGGSALDGLGGEHGDEVGGAGAVDRWAESKQFLFDRLALQDAAAMVKPPTETDKKIVDMTRKHLINDLLGQSDSVCAVITSGAAVHHENYQETNALLGYSTKKLLNEYMMEIVAQTFPSFYLMGKGPKADPTESGSKLLQSKRLLPGCSM